MYKQFNFFAVFLMTRVFVFLTEVEHDISLQHNIVGLTSTMT